MADVFGIRPWEIDDLTPKELEDLVAYYQARLAPG